MDNNEVQVATPLEAGHETSPVMLFRESFNHIPFVSTKFLTQVLSCVGGIPGLCNE